MDLSLRQILERYKDDSEILKHVLTAKVEEDKIEQARIQLRELDIELMREHGKATIRYYDTKQQQQHQQQPTVRYTTPPLPPTPIQPSLTSSSSSYHNNNNSNYNKNGSTLPPISSYQGLAPVQQQVLERITSKDHRSSSSSYEAYPHSAHPLCLPSSSSSSSDTARRNNHSLYYNNHNQHQSSTPISPGGGIDELIIRKRGRNSVNELTSESNGNNNSDNSLSHNQVMEALKAKIQRGNSICSNNNNVNGEVDRNNNNKRARTSAIKVEVDRDSIVPPSTPSPRSAKPILPPIDTNMGRDRTQYHQNETNNNNKYRIPITTTKTTTSSSSSSSADHSVRELSSNSSSLSSARSAEKQQETVKSETNSLSSASSFLSEPNTSS
ncbi:hypothetical protein INT45_002884 [Circinella minor]|uniref:Uncharacterized protein n=1 Tax=Circinella minor TaxID=1195481 RepID=A0A8H7VQK2_9FUNG|nr:hypothetical protein INT45_002884 [Circinella minor]